MMKFSQVTSLTILSLCLNIACSKSGPAPRSTSQSTDAGTATTGSDISGKISIDGIQSNGKPVHVVLSKVSDVSQLSKVSEDKIITVKTVNDDGSFTIDPAKEGLKKDDVISISAFLDMDYNNGTPKLTVDDYVGFYFNPGTYSTEFKLSDNNPAIKINVNRKVYDYEKTVDVQLVGSYYKGPVLGIIYTGEINSSVSSNLDPDSIIGFTTTDKASVDLDISIDVLPYGQDLPIQESYIFLILDKNGNGTMDPGEKYGVYTNDAERGVPSPVKIDSDTDFGEGLIIQAKYTVPVPSGEKVSVSGKLSSTLGSSSKDRYVFVSKANSIDEFIDSPNEKMQAFIKVPKGTSTFDIDLSDTALKAGDQIMVMAMQDNDMVGQFPKLDEGDYVGLYKDQTAKSSSLVLKTGGNANISIDINKTYQSYEEGMFTARFADSAEGNYVLVAYKGDKSDVDSNNIDMDKIVSFVRFEKYQEIESYEAKILPFYEASSLSSVLVYCFKDLNKDGKRQSNEAIIKPSSGIRQSIDTAGSMTIIDF